MAGILSCFLRSLFPCPCCRWCWELACSWLNGASYQPLRPNWGEYKPSEDDDDVVVLYQSPVCVECQQDDGIARAQVLFRFSLTWCLYCHYTSFELSLFAEKFFRIYHLLHLVIRSPFYRYFLSNIYLEIFLNEVCLLVDNIIEVMH